MSRMEDTNITIFQHVAVSGLELLLSAMRRCGKKSNRYQGLMIRSVFISVSVATVVFLTACESDQDQKPRPRPHHQFGYNGGNANGRGTGRREWDDVALLGGDQHGDRADCAAAAHTAATDHAGTEHDAERKWDQPGQRDQRHAGNPEARLPVCAAGGGQAWICDESLRAVFRLRGRAGVPSGDRG